MAFGSRASPTGGSTTSGQQGPASPSGSVSTTAEGVKHLKQARALTKRLHSAQRDADEARVRAMQLEKALRSELGDDIPLEEVLAAISAGSVSDAGDGYRGFPGEGGSAARGAAVGASGRGGWRGRAQRIVMLKAKLRRLQG